MRSSKWGGGGPECTESLKIKKKTKRYGQGFGGEGQTRDSWSWRCRGEKGANHLAEGNSHSMRE